MYIYLDLEVLNLPSYKHPSRSHDHRPVFNVKNNKQQTNTYTEQKLIQKEERRFSNLLSSVIYCSLNDSI